VSENTQVDSGTSSHVPRPLLITIIKRDNGVMQFITRLSVMRASRKRPRMKKESSLFPIWLENY